MPTRCNRSFYCRSYCLLNMFRAPLFPSSGAQEYYTVVAACGIWCCGFQVVGPVWSCGLCVRFAECYSIACSTCFGHHYAHHQELKSIIQWLLPVGFGAVVFKLLVWCGAVGYVSGLQDAAALLAQHVSGTTMPIIRRSRLLYSGCCLRYLVLWLSSCWSGVDLWVMCPVCRMLKQHPAPHQTNNLKATAPNTTGSNHCIILLSSR